MRCSTSIAPTSVRAKSSGALPPNARTGVVSQSRAWSAFPSNSSIARANTRAARTSRSDSSVSSRPADFRRARVRSGISISFANAETAIPALR